MGGEKGCRWEYRWEGRRGVDGSIGGRSIGGRGEGV